MPERVIIGQKDDLVAGTLRIARAEAYGGIEQLYLLDGDCVSGTVSSIIAFSDDDVPPSVSSKQDVHLRVFHFNDLHNHLTDLSGKTKGTHRFSQMVKRVSDARKSASENEAVLFLSIGDDHTGTGFDELLGWNEDQFIASPAYRVYSAAGVDCSVLGNHEFDRGSLLLAKGIRQDAQFPILSANVHSSSHLEPGRDYFPAAIAVVKGLRIGMIGLTTKVETKVGQPGDPGLAVASPVDVLTNLMPTLAALVDAVFILSHCGYGDGEHKSGKASAVRDIGEADFALARAARIISKKPTFILGAHTHTVINENLLEDANIIAGVPVLQAGGKGQFIGEVSLAFDAQRNCEIGKVCLHPIVENVGANGQNDGDFDAAFENAHITPLINRIEDSLTREIATVSTNALSYESAELDRYSGESALLNFMCDAIYTRMDEAQYGVDFCLLNGATALAGIEKGSLSQGAWFDVMPYADQIYIVTMSGAELEAILQNNAKRILRPEEIAETDYSGFLPRGFTHTSSHIRYSIDLGNSAAAAKAISIEVNGQSIASLQSTKFKVAMPTYLALGAFGERWNGETISGGVPGNLAGFDMRQLPATNTGLIYRNQISAFILAAKHLEDRDYIDGRLKLMQTESEAA